jgi:hypothetical protein
MRACLHHLQRHGGVRVARRTVVVVVVVELTRKTTKTTREPLSYRFRNETKAFSTRHLCELVDCRDEAFAGDKSLHGYVARRRQLTASAVAQVSHEAQIPPRL